MDSVTTPFGRRPMTLALMKSQLETAEITGGKTVDKWKVFRDACEARGILGIQDRALAVLDALLTFYPDSELSEERGLVVFPSNAQLSVRAHGIAGTTLTAALGCIGRCWTDHPQGQPERQALCPPQWIRRPRAGLRLQPGAAARPRRRIRSYGPTSRRGAQTVPSDQGDTVALPARCPQTDLRRRWRRALPAIGG